MVLFTETNRHKEKREASGRKHRGKLMGRTQTGGLGLYAHPRDRFQQAGEQHWHLRRF